MLCLASPNGMFPSTRLLAILGPLGARSRARERSGATSTWAAFWTSRGSPSEASEAQKRADGDARRSQGSRPSRELLEWFPAGVGVGVGVGVFFFFCWCWFIPFLPCFVFFSFLLFFLGGGSCFADCRLKVWPEVGQLCTGSRPASRALPSIRWGLPGHRFGLNIGFWA